MSPPPWIIRRASARLRWLAALALALAGLALPAPAARATALFTVDVVSDLAPAAANGSCYDAAAGGCTLREAVQEAAVGGNAIIDFAAGLAGATIALANSLGALYVDNDNVTIDGTTRGITVSGASLAADQSVFVLRGNSVELRNLSVRDAPQDGVVIGSGDLRFSLAANNTVRGLTITGSGRAGISIERSSGGGYIGGGSGATIRESLIGAASSSVSACSDAAANSYGILIGHGVVGAQVVLNTIVCNRNDGIWIDGPSTLAATRRTSIWQNDIGSNGTIALGNGAAGIAITGNAHRIDLLNNLISGNGHQGISITGSDTSDITIAGSLIGLNQSGTAALPNAWDGVAIDGVRWGNITLDGANRISGNGRSGVLIRSSALVTVKASTISGNSLSGIQLSNGHYVTVKGNTIGTDSSGAVALGNSMHGVELSNGSTDNVIGDANASERNVISGNALDGVSISGGATGNTVDNNLIGLSASGAAAIPNGRHGVAIFGAGNNQIGGSQPRTQFISGNAGAGIYVESASGTVIGQANQIGVATDGATPRGNQQEGVLLKNTSGTGVFAGTIAHNGGAGVALSGDGFVIDNAILPGAVHDNGGLPIDLGADGPTPNDPGDGDAGPNWLLNYPEISSASGSNIAGTVCAGCTVLIYYATGNPDAPGGGGSYLTSVTAAADGRWSATLSDGLTRWDISTIACAAPCSATSDTSEMSPIPNTRPRVFLPLL